MIAGTLWMTMTIWRIMKRQCFCIAELCETCPLRSRLKMTFFDPCTGTIMRRPCKMDLNLIQQYFSFNRMSKESALVLIAMLRPMLPGVRKNGISPEMQVLIALRFYAEGPYQRGLGQDCLHPVSQPTASVILGRVSTALCSMADRYIRFPQTEEERISVERKYVYLKLSIC